MDDRTRTRQLPDGSTLRVSFHGEQKPAKKPPAAKETFTKGVRVALKANKSITGTVVRRIPNSGNARVEWNGGVSETYTSNESLTDLVRVNAGGAARNRNRPMPKGK